ncbi:MAG: tRNA (adenosine(37)-N6)-threonylcarbamoyltransferase complex transferase subunit TsaD [Candidatus Moranbacteria bacterium]|nr:tRNA (adenosine(37)-N6)-threonylcarbamoyltransferase complex transferase subunit TsaD [Candidatus Moranbacteria bacterium]
MNTERSPIILAIETSCDDTAAAVVALKDGVPTVLSSVVSSQIELHRQYGGVVPALAAREHVKNLVPVINEAIRAASVSRDDIDAIAVTQGPGLIPALLAGVSAAKALALVWQKPLLGVHHIEGHIYANFVRADESKVKSKKLKDCPVVASSRLYGVESQEPETTDGNKSLPARIATQSVAGGPQKTQYSLSEREKTVKSDIGNWKLEIGNSCFPLLALVVSGGHTELVLMRGHFEYEILGRTKDDAAGEAFDKVAKMLGLPYPGGPEVAARATIVTSRESQVESRNSDNETGHTFPRPMIDSGNYDFSFSGLKTAVLYEIRKTAEENRDETFVNGICHAFQEAVVDVLTTKTRRAIEEYAPATLVIAGGVSANIALRESLATMITEFPSTAFTVPEFKYSLDNAAMIGTAALLRFTRLSKEDREDLKQNAIGLEPDANLPLS